MPIRPPRATRLAVATPLVLAVVAAAAGSLAACGGADERDTDRTSLQANAPADVMQNDTTVAVIPGAAAAGGAVSGADVFPRCAACHQANGQGLPGTYPPLAGSEWVVGNPEVPIRIVLHGLQGPITVKGASYNNAMMAFADQLSDAEIAAVISYERSSWGNSAAPVTAEQVRAVRDATKAQTTPWAPSALQGMLKGGG